MTADSQRLMTLVQEQRMKEFLSFVIKEGTIGIAFLDKDHQSILHMTSEGITSNRFVSLFSSNPVTNWLRTLEPKPNKIEIHRKEDEPIYATALTTNHASVGTVVGWLPEEKETNRSRREFGLICRHIQDILDYRYELDNLSSEIVRNYDELSLLYDLSVKLGSQPDLGTICELVVDQVHTILPGSSVALLLLDKETNMLRSELAVDGQGQPLPEVGLKQHEGITGKVLQSRQATIVCDVNEHPEFVRVSYPIKSLMSVPMTMGDKSIGVLNVSDKTDQQEFTTYDLKLVTAIAAVAAVSLENARHFGEVKELYLSAVKSLVMAIDAKDPYTHSHSIRVAQLSSTVAEVLGLDSKEVEDIRLAALLHDVGKIGIPEHVLLKTGKLTNEEWESMKQHPLLSVQILEHFKPFQHISKWVRCEHERHDGKGYPDGLSGEEIPLPSRIIAAADAFDAITSDRYYRKRRSDEVAIEILETHSGTQFDPEVIKAFVKAYRQGKLKSDPHQ